MLDQIDGKLRSIVVDLTTDDEIEVEANKPKKTCLKKRPTDISPIVCKKSQNKINNYFSPQILRSKSAGPYLNPIDTFVFKVFELKFKKFKKLNLNNFLIKLRKIQRKKLLFQAMKMICFFLPLRIKPKINMR